MSGITTGNLRLISQELLDDLDRVFGPPEVEAKTPVEDIKWAAAQRSVVDWIKAKAATQQQVGQPDNTPGRATPTGAIVRLGQ